MEYSVKNLLSFFFSYNFHLCEFRTSWARRVCVLALCVCVCANDCAAGNTSIRVLPRIDTWTRARGHVSSGVFPPVRRRVHGPRGRQCPRNRRTGFARTRTRGERSFSRYRTVARTPERTRLSGTALGLGTLRALYSVLMPDFILAPRLRSA